MSENGFSKTFARRSLFCFFIICCLFFVTILRISVIATDSFTQTNSDFNSIKIKISTTRGTIFDCNKYPITNSQKKIIAAVSPTPRAITAISKALPKENLESVLETLKHGKPAICELNEKINCDGIICTEIYENTAHIPAIHTVGYTDNENNGVSGIEKAYNSLLKNQNDTYIRYACDGKGRVLTGVEPEILNKVSPYSNSVVTTIDINVQKIAEEASDDLGLGAIVIADAKTSKIRAITSRPNFRTDTIEELLTDQTTPLFNRALAAYNVGSVFKPLVAAASIENNLEAFSCNCKGSLKIIDRTFHCHEEKGHNFVNLENAIAKSCNIYFFKLSHKLGDNPITKYANILNFGKSITICDNIHTSKGSLPTTESLENPAHLANFSIGQGAFLASPISMLPLYCAIANGGEYYLPSLVESTIQNGKETKYKIGYPTKAFSKETAQKLKNALSLVIKDGTGTLAQPQTVSAGGKTATAQTGKHINGRELISSWFCGFFPLEDPKYVIIIFSEDTTKQTKSCAKIFAEIADKITALP
jgi:cell division protein FtsI/penicillin-binding protein 2